MPLEPVFPKRKFTMRPVVPKSRVLSHVGWFSVGLLVVRLNSGDVWCYRVPGDNHKSRARVWRSFLRSKSKGRWFNRRVRGKLEGAKLQGDVKREIERYCDMTLTGDT